MLTYRKTILDELNTAVDRADPTFTLRRIETIQLQELLYQLGRLPPDDDYPALRAAYDALMWA